MAFKYLYFIFVIFLMTKLSSPVKTLSSIEKQIVDIFKYLQKPQIPQNHTGSRITNGIVGIIGIFIVKNFFQLRKTNIVYFTFNFVNDLDIVRDFLTILVTQYAPPLNQNQYAADLNRNDRQNVHNSTISKEMVESINKLKKIYHDVDAKAEFIDMLAVLM